MDGEFFKAMGLSLILAGLTACANPLYANPRQTILLWQLERPLYFRSDEVPACGDPIASEDVLVVRVDIDEDVGNVVQQKAGTDAEFSDQWYRYRSGLVHPNKLIKSAQVAFAERGCNLLVLTKEPISRNNLTGAEEFIGLRWGMH